ncbi:hypothetical protein [Microbacterium oleivorans]|uniref:Uncharacterized protein n=1 Tax=Microbacterium oleivorans TaxID=273677 RepID=A0A4R5YGY9_9MICO|nr:hypothetical protein [Microbacterium oleivorans]TDL43589.1 hypothetical protein E2R54_10270 [Microbacterium oleivorans]
MPDIQLQLDPASALLSLIALVISVLAYRRAKKDPLRDLRREKREEVRAALRPGADAAQALLTKKDVALPVAESIVEAFATAESVLKTNANRLPEATSLRLMEQQLRMARLRLRTLESMTRALDTYRTTKKDLDKQRDEALAAKDLDRAAVIRESIDGTEQRISAQLRSVEEYQAQFKRFIRDFRGGAREYLHDLDSKERSGKLD